jgi:hypothetical protein
VLGYRTWAVCGFRVFVLEDYNSTTSALSLHPLFLATVLLIIMSQGTLYRGILEEMSDLILMIDD